MVVFQDIDDVIEWLEPMGYVEFWEATEPYRVFEMADRDHCDLLIRKGRVDQNLILDGLKAMARVQLTCKFGLPPRIPEPVDAQYIRSMH